MAFEQELFQQLVASDDAKALRYAFFSERVARKVPAMPKLSTPLSLRSAAVVGAGTMGTGIAMAFADGGIPVLLMDVDAAAAGRGLKRIRSTYDARVARGSLQQSARDERVARITAVSSYQALALCDVAVEAVFEDTALKQGVVAALESVLHPGALLLSNTSTIDIDEIALHSARPGQIAGAHFFSPANVMKLLEVVDGPRTAPETLAKVFELGRRLGKIAVVSASHEGFVANRSRTPFGAEVQYLLEEGATPQQIDRVMVEFGFPVGPLVVGDMAGLDIGYAVRQRKAASDPKFRASPIPDRMFELGRLGQKTAAGWYRYEAGSYTPLVDPAVMEIIETVCRERGIARRPISDEMVLLRPLLAAVNEACHILEEGVAVRPSDVDVMWLYGFGFPRQRGGLMYWADTLGAKAIVAQIDAWREQLGPHWDVSPLLREVADRGGSLVDIPSRWRKAALSPKDCK